MSPMFNACCAPKHFCFLPAHYQCFFLITHLMHLVVVSTWNKIQKTKTQQRKIDFENQVHRLSVGSSMTSLISIFFSFFFITASANKWWTFHHSSSVWIRKNTSISQRNHHSVKDVQAALSARTWRRVKAAAVALKKKTKIKPNAPTQTHTRICQAWLNSIASINVYDLNHRKRNKWKSMLCKSIHLFCKHKIYAGRFLFNFCFFL